MPAFHAGQTAREIGVTRNAVIGKMPSFGETKLPRAADLVSLRS